MPEITGIPLFLYPEIHSGHAMISLESHDDFTRVTGVFDTGQNTTSLGWFCKMTRARIFQVLRQKIQGAFPASTCKCQCKYLRWPMKVLALANEGTCIFGSDFYEPVI